MTKSLLMRTLILTILFLSGIYNATAQFTATITPGGPTTFCLGDSVLLIANSGADTYQWLLNGTPITSANDDTLVVHVAGNYEVAIDSAGYVDTSLSEAVTVNTVPAQPGPISGPDTFCVGTTQTFMIDSVPGAATYTWMGGHMNYGSWEDFHNTVTTQPIITGIVGDAPVMFNGGTPMTYITVIANNACGSSPHTALAVASYSPPQIGGFSNGGVDIADLPGVLCPMFAPYELFPVTHASVSGYTDASSLQWYLGPNPLPGETGFYLSIMHGGDYSVHIITDHCGTITIPKKVFQAVPNSATISPPGPLSCQSNVPLQVNFDMTGVNKPFHWGWAVNARDYPGGFDVMSILPDTSGVYYLFASENGQDMGTCYVFSNFVNVTVPSPLNVTEVDDTLYASPGFISYQWYENSTLIPGATSQTYVLSYDGVYAVTGIDSNGCASQSDTIFGDYQIIGGGQEEEEEQQQQEQQQKEISVYPNPNTGAFTLVAKVPGENKTAAITITDVMGHVIFSKHAEVKDGQVEEKIDFKDDIGRLCIIKVKAKGCNKTSSFLKQ